MNIETLELRPQDILLVSTDMVMSQDQVTWFKTRLREQLEAIGLHNEIIVVSGAKLSVVRAA